MPQSSSSPQTVTTVQIFDYVLDDQGVAMQNVQVRCIVNGAVFSTISPLVLISPLQLSTTTDGNGYFTFNVIPNDNIQPANTTYTIITPFRNYDITVPSGGPWQTTAVGILVNVPVALAPAVTSVTGPLTVQSGGLTISAGGLTVAGGITLTSGTLSLAGAALTMLGPLTLTAAASQVIPGATSFSVRDTANANDNLLVSNAGVVTVRAGLTVTAGGLTVTAGNITATASALNLGTGAITSGAVNGQTISAAASFTGTVTSASTLTVTAGGLTVTAGGLTVTAGAITMAAAASQIVPGATSLALRDNANANNNVLVSNAGLVTLRNGLLLPAAAAGALAPNSAYATVPIKIDDQLLAAPAASITFINPLPTNFRHLLIEWYTRGDTAALSTFISARFNNISTTTYDFLSVANTNATVVAASESITQTAMQIGTIPAASATANYFGVGTAKVHYYNGAVGNKLVESSSAFGQADITASIYRLIFIGKWRTTATPVTRIDLLPGAGNFVTGSVFTLWGIP